MITKFKLLFILFVLGTMNSVFCQDKRPNILFIVADDMGAWTLGSSKNENSFTPELDKLADDGALFTNAFSNSAVCSPSRAALISGRYPSECNVLDVLYKESINELDTSLILWPEVLLESGYQTALVGKWHLGERPESFPENRGFSKFSGFLHGGLLSKDPVVRIEGKDTIFTGKYTPDVLADLTIGYIEEFANQPWVISLNFWAPHANTRFPKDFSPPYDDRSWLPMQDLDMDYWKNLKLTLPEPHFPKLNIERTERMMREYLSSVHSVDRNVGRILKFLEQSNLEKNTIVIFTSDHGYMMGHHGLWHKGNGRWLTENESDPTGFYTNNRPNMFDNSLKVPFIVKWPEKIKAGSLISETITFLDCYPTLLEMTGVLKPVDLILHGKSFMPLLNDTKTNWDNVFYGQYKTLRCIQTREWKFVIDYNNLDRNELYHLSNDPKEQYNLIKSTDSIVIENKNKLEKQLFKKMKEIGDMSINK